MEHWKDIKGYEGLYQISDKGRVRSHDRTIKTHEKFGGERKIRGKIKSTQLTVGYPTVKLCKDGIMSNSIYVHRLVAEAFIPNKDDKPEVNHKDANRQNNNVDNLEWVTHLENIQHSECLKRRTPNTEPAVNTLKKKVIRSDGQIFESITEAGKRTGCDRREIGKVCQGKKKTINGYTFRYF